MHRLANELPPALRFKKNAESASARQHHKRLKALELFASRGFAQTGMRELAAHMGITAGSIYNHIESKQALLFDFIEELYVSLLSSVSPSPSTQDQAREQLHALLAAHIALHDSKGMHFLLAEREMHCLDDEQAETIRTLRTAYEHKFANLLASAADLGISPQLTALAKSSVALLNNLPTWLTQDRLDPVSRSQLINSIVRASITGTLQDLRSMP